MSSFASSSSVTSRISRGVKWTAVGFVVSKLFTLLSAVYLSRLFGRASYGELGVIQNTTGLFGVFAGAGLGLAATKFIASFRATSRDRVSRILGLVCVSSACFTGATVFFILVFSESIATHWLNNSSLTLPLRLGCLLMAANVAYEILSAILAGFEDFRSTSFAEMVRGVIVLPAAFLFAPQLSVLGAIWAFTVASVVGSIFLLLRVKALMREKGFRISTLHCTDEIHVITKFSIPALLSSSIPVPVIWFSTVLLAQTPSGYDELGIYNAANQLRLIIMMIPILLSRVLVPLLAKEHEEGNLSSFKRALEGANFATIILILPVSVFLACTGEYVMSIFGKDFSLGWQVLVFIIAGSSVSAIGSVIGSTVVATGNMWAGVLQNFIWSLTYIVSVFLQYKHGGAMALANSFLLAHLVLLYITVVFLWKRKLIGKEMGRNILISAGVVVVTSISCLYISSTMRLLSAIPVSFLICLVAVRWLMPIEIESFLQRKGDKFKLLMLKRKIL